MKQKWSEEDYSKYLYIISVYPHWKELKYFDSARIHEIYKNVLEREEKRKERLEDEKKYHQMTLWEVGLR